MDRGCYTFKKRKIKIKEAYSTGLPWKKCQKVLCAQGRVLSQHLLWRPVEICIDFILMIEIVYIIGFVMYIIHIKYKINRTIRSSLNLENENFLSKILNQISHAVTSHLALNQPTRNVYGFTIVITEYGLNLVEIGLSGEKIQNSPWIIVWLTRKVPPWQIRLVRTDGT